MGSGRDVAVTIAVVPRETLSRTESTLRSILEHTAGPYRLLCVDGGSPSAQRDRLETLARQEGITLLRSESWLTPNEARNLAWRHIDERHPDCEYIVFADNDLLVSPGWLEALVDRATREQAAAVGPLTMIGSPGTTRIHIAGGELRLVDLAGRRGLHETHRFGNRDLEDVRDQLVAGPSESVEFHGVLLRRDLRDRLGPLDEALMVSHEHLDLCLTLAQLGERIWFEPASVVTYVPPPPFVDDDRSYFLMRWCRRWCQSGDAHMAAKWGLEDTRWLRASHRWHEHYRWIAYGRAPVNRRPRKFWKRALAGAERAFYRVLDCFTEWTLVRAALKRRKATREWDVQMVALGRVLGDVTASRTSVLPDPRPQPRVDVT